MKGSYINPHLIINQQGIEVSDELLVVKDCKFEVYEVVRVLLGKALFLDDHLVRLNLSLKGLGVEHKVMSDTEVISGVNRLCELHKKDYGNIEIKVVKEICGSLLIFMGFIPHAYPKPTDYILGVKTELLFAERDQPNIKMKGSSARLLADEKLINSEIYEVLLVNSKGEITEGSRSNVFFISGNIVYTSPNEYVLKGVTRNCVLSVLCANNIKTQFDPIKYNEIHTIDAAFICGTSPGILPIRSISTFPLDVNNTILREIMEGYNDLLKKYITQ